MQLIIRSKSDSNIAERLLAGLHEAIEGSYIPIIISPSLQDPNCNRNGGLSQNVMVPLLDEREQLHMHEYYKFIVHGPLRATTVNSKGDAAKIGV
ncbi:hypothetical protein U9M48_023407 [Paspalum notatum var. saurae]|uniref:Uncharacterized protein n=1 Tax=Paspalum notatum var. saurae TaxID=547442 RepID=A0AAQ3TLM7_PASNO